MPNRDYLIRPARQAEIAVIRAMQERSMWSLGAGFYMPEEIAGLLTEVGTMDDAVVLEGHYFVAADGRGAIVGSGGWSRLVPGYARNSHALALAPHDATVRSVFVDPAAARRGIGTAIMLHIEEDAARHGIRRLRLAATRSGVPLYASLDYLACGRRSFILAGGLRFECLEMEKALARALAAS